VFGMALNTVRVSSLGDSEHVHAGAPATV